MTQTELRQQRWERLEQAGGVRIADDLPIAATADELIAAVANHQVVIVAGETGSGKSTQLPKICLLAGRGRAGLIGHTQPRRVAARSVAERVAGELGSAIGDAVGYTVRFNDRVADHSLIQVMTDGILLNEIQRDPKLSRYDTLIIDEAHERSLNIDFILGYLRQLLPRRPDLRVIVTSATIDTDRFAAHFSGPRPHADNTAEHSTASANTPAVLDGPVRAPVFVVQGRTYPVEVRYRPYGPDHDPTDRRDQVAAVVDAVDELWAACTGDILVFLSGEREIRDTADAVRQHFGAHKRGGVDVLGLYSRQSAHEQHRIFQSHGGRRVVLATNIAETSITVPGVQAVIDVGTARISRYSKRLKVQRLPIEPISQASANQRAGRCGRTGPGIAIRLYAEDDYEQRAEFTEPEILRTNLASVILQMTAIGLGDVTKFPFVEPPDQFQINDGYRLLDELGAIKPGRIGARRSLTGTGRTIARLPVDPRLGRMLVESGRRQCVREVLVIASALSIQDVREWPDEHREHARELHSRFNVAGSDLLSIVALWDYLRDRQRELSSSAFRRLCHAEYLHYLRVREWRDLYSQLRQVAGRLTLRPSTLDAHPDHVHQAVLAGLLSHIGEQDGTRNEYRGARDARFAIERGSLLARRPPSWVMAAELVETNRLWARRVAAIDPAWCEPLAGDLAKRSTGEPFWQAARGRAATTETVTLYGRPIVRERTVSLDRIDPTLARQLFITYVLVAGQWPDGAVAGSLGAFVEHNRRFLARVSMLAARVRRDDLYDDASLFAFYDARIPDDVTSVVGFERWWSQRHVDTPELLNFDNSVLADRRGIDLSDYPQRWHTDQGEFRIDYRFAPGTALDGASICIPVASLGTFNPAGLDWSVPGYRRDLIDHLLRGLPKQLRRDLIPMADTADAVAIWLNETTSVPKPAFAQAVAAALQATRGLDVSPALLDAVELPAWLRMHLVVVDNDGDVLDAGDDFAALVERQARNVRAAVAEVAEIDELRGLTDWTFGDLPTVVRRDTPNGSPVSAYPTLVDAGASVTLRAVDNEGLALRALAGGVHRLLLLNAAPRTERVRATLPPDRQLAVAAAELVVDELVDDAIAAAVDAIALRVDHPRSRADYDGIAERVRAESPSLAADALATAVDVLISADRVHHLLMQLRAPAAEPTRLDAAAHRDRLIAPGFVRRAGTARLPDLHRYMNAIVARLEHLNGDIEKDLRRMAQVRPIESSIARGVASQPAQRAGLNDVVWMLEELRVSVFAARLGHVKPISAKRIKTAYQDVTGSPPPE